MSSSRPSWSDRKLPAFFTQWRAEWKDEELTPANYLDFEGGLRFVLAAAWLFCPETVEYRGGVFLKDRFGQDNIDNWFTTLDGDRERIEAVANHVELWALFGNTPSQPTTTWARNSPNSPWPWGSPGRASSPRAIPTARSRSR